MWQSLVEKINTYNNIFQSLYCVGKGGAHYVERSNVIKIQDRIMFANSHIPYSAKCSRRIIFVVFTDSFHTAKIKLAKSFQNLQLRF